MDVEPSFQARNSNYQSLRAALPKSSRVIRTGPYSGLPKRQTTDRSKYLAIDQVRQAVNAASFAETLSLPLNAQITIAWRHSPAFAADGSNWSKVQTKLFDRIVRYLMRHKITTAFVWTRERQRGRGPHTHVAIHLGQKPKQIRKELQTYITKTFDFEREGIDFQMGDFGAQTPEMRAGILRYALKAIDHTDFRYTGNGTETENIGQALGIEHRGSHGVINIKRSGISQNIGPAARKQGGWIELRDIASLARKLTPNRKECPTSSNTSGHRKVTVNKGFSTGLCSGTNSI